MTYIKELNRILTTGEATEMSYRHALITWVESFQNTIKLINEPKKIDCGKPDIIALEESETIGHIETKDLYIELDDLQQDEQVMRYKTGLQNFILTNYLDFIWYQDGKEKKRATLAKKQKGKLTVFKNGIKPTEQLIQSFLDAKTVNVKTPEELAIKMARYCSIIRDSIRDILSIKDRESPLRHHMASFKNVLIRDLDEKRFSDMFAQTLCYGLFAAKVNAGNKPISRHEAASSIPKTNPFLQKTFYQFSGVEIDDAIIWVVEDFMSLLNRIDIEELLKDFGKEVKKEDPILHFYETFLSVYDPKERSIKGNYFTPDPVVSYIVRSVDEILKEDFRLTDGLANAEKIQTEGKETHKVQLLDPATGTGTFLYHIISHIHDTLKHQKGAWKSYVSDHLLPRVHGFEIQMAPYSIAHMKLGMLLKKTGYDFKSEERLRLFLTNTLQKGYELDHFYDFSYFLAKEANAAKEIKMKTPVMAIVGNPPYTDCSVDEAGWIDQLMRGVDSTTGESVESYFDIDEKNMKWLNKDYVKFLRFSQWKIERTGHGVVAFICNNAFLDSRTFRGMRSSLMNTFDELFFLNLNGDLRRGGNEDENVFDIIQGVTVCFLIKKKRQNRPACDVYYQDVRGGRDKKYALLESSCKKGTKWEKIEPSSPHFLFKPKNNQLEAEWNKGYPLDELMPVSNTCIASSWDGFAINHKREGVKDKINDLKALSDDELLDKYELKESKRKKIKNAKKDVSLNYQGDHQIKPILYRPFDVRYTLYTGKSNGFLERPRKEAMEEMIQGHNLAIITNKVNKNESGVSNTWGSCHITDLHLLETGNANPNIFPLYKAGGINLDERFIKKVKKIDDKLTERNIFYYLYAVLQSPSYLKRFKEELKYDYPKIPLTTNGSLFKSLSYSGRHLFECHVEKAAVAIKTTFDQEGDNRVTNVKHENETLWINEKQYIKGVTEAVWHYKVGGYFVIQKWLDERKNQSLSYDAIMHLQKMVAWIKESNKILKGIDQSIAKHGGFPLV